MVHVLFALESVSSSSHETNCYKVTELTRKKTDMVRHELLNIVEHLAAEEQIFPPGGDQTQSLKGENVGLTFIR